MNIITFRSRSDVIYGMEQAAKYVRKTAVLEACAKGPRPLNTREECIESHAAASAYMDMVTRNNSFMYTLNNYWQPNHDRKSLAEILKKQEVYNRGSIEPFKDFELLMLENAKKNCPKDLVAQVKNFLKDIAEKL